MGEVISMEQRRQAWAQGPDGRSHRRGVATSVRPATRFWFDLASPSTYFAAERAERMFPGLTWSPVLAGPGLEPPSAPPAHDVAIGAATARAAALRMPLVWPEGAPGSSRAPMRVAAFAAERGQGSAFVLAASRLAFCGGFDLHDPEILAEAAAAAALPIEECLQAAGDRGRDAAMEVAGRALVAQGADQLPVLSVGRRLFCGEERLVLAAAAVRDPCSGESLDGFAG